MNTCVTLDAIRTPIGALGGVRPDDMTVHVIKSILSRTRIHHISRPVRHFAVRVEMFSTHAFHIFRIARYTDEREAFAADFPSYCAP